MAPEIKSNLDKIIETCKKMQVKSLYVFGSGSRGGDYKKESDLDFLYTMFTGENGLPSGHYDYFDLLFKLEEITGKKVDLIAEKGIRNKYFLKSVMEDRQKIYEA
ncbi:MAG: nucleotidyltransferase domain-containing protein [Bacteroidota bacterium]